MIWVIGAGGSLGAAARFMLGEIVNKQAQKAHPFPWATWIVNISGSFFLGLITQLYFSSYISEWVWLFTGVGFCGAFTTFSTFGIETIRLLQSNKIKSAAIYVVASVIVGLAAAMIGFYI